MKVGRPAPPRVHLLLLAHEVLLKLLRVVAVPIVVGVLLLHVELHQGQFLWGVLVFVVAVVLRVVPLVHGLVVVLMAPVSALFGLGLRHALPERLSLALLRRSTGGAGLALSLAQSLPVCLLRVVVLFLLLEPLLIVVILKGGIIIVSLLPLVVAPVVCLTRLVVLLIVVAAVLVPVLGVLVGLRVASVLAVVVLELLLHLLFGCKALSFLLLVDTLSGLGQMPALEPELSSTLMTALGSSLGARMAEF